MQLPVNHNSNKCHADNSALTRSFNQETEPLFDFDHCLEQGSHCSLKGTERKSNKRAQVESYIAERFKDVHQANVDHFLPLLMSVVHQDDLGAAIGVKLGSQGPMFLEHYLASPVEQQIAALEKKPISRNQIAEIGNLVITHKPSGFILFLVLASVLDRAGFQWMTFTATPVVEKMLR
jgi:hypothetical protein